MHYYGFNHHHQLPTVVSIYSYTVSIYLSIYLSIYPSPFLLFKGECKYEIQELRIALAETTGELNKSRKLLALQNTISRDCKKELDTVRIESEQMRMDYEKRLQESAQLLDIRSARVKVRMTERRERERGSQTTMFFTEAGVTVKGYQI